MERPRVGELLWEGLIIFQSAFMSRRVESFYVPEERWHTRWALVATLIVSLLLVFLFGRSLKDSLEDSLEEYQLLSKGMSESYYLGLTFFALMVGATVFICWKRCRKNSLLSGGQPQIVFALSFDEGCQWLVNQFYKNFCRNVNERGLGKIISAALTSSCSRVIHRDEADQMLQDGKAAIIVYGHLHYQKKGQKKASVFQSIAFSFREERNSVFGQILQAFPCLPEERANLMERSVLVEDFSFISQFLIGLSLTLEGNSQEARLVWSDLRIDISKQRGWQSSLRDFYQKTQKWWVRNEMFHVGSLYETYIKGNVANGLYHSEAKKALVILENGRELFSVSPVYFLYKAIFQFHLGEYRSSRRTIEKGLKKFPEWGICFESFFAFLALWRRFYAKAFRHYQSIRKHPLIPEYHFFALGFLGSVIRANLHRKDLFFGLAFLRDHCNVTEDAAMEYSLFKKSCVSDTEIKCLLDYSDSRLENYHKKEKKRLASPENVAA